MPHTPKSTLCTFLFLPVFPGDRPSALRGFWLLCSYGGPTVCLTLCLSDQTSPNRGVQTFGASGPRWKKKSCLGPHVKYTNTNKK